MIVVLMGVTGSGKTTVGKVLAKELGWKFYDADDYHPPENIEKMHRGIPLTDEDRKPWLQALAKLIDDARDRGENIVLACSALKHAYQEYLRHHLDVVRYVCLCGPPEVIQKVRFSSGWGYDQVERERVRSLPKTSSPSRTRMFLKRQTLSSSTSSSPTSARPTRPTACSGRSPTIS